MVPGDLSPIGVHWTHCALMMLYINVLQSGGLSNWIHIPAAESGLHQLLCYMPLCRLITQMVSGYVSLTQLNSFSAASYLSVLNTGIHRSGRRMRSGRFSGSGTRPPSQRQLCLAQRVPFLGTLPAHVKVGGDPLHLASVQPAIQIFRKLFLDHRSRSSRLSSPRGISNSVMAGGSSPISAP